VCVPRRAAGVFSGYSNDSSFSDLVKSGESTLLSNTCTNQCPAPQAHPRQPRSSAMPGTREADRRCTVCTRIWSGTQHGSFDRALGVTSRSAAAPGDAAQTLATRFRALPLSEGGLGGGVALKGSRRVLHEPSSPCAPGPARAG
jgi:hypothetical protein